MHVCENMAWIYDGHCYNLCKSTLVLLVVCWVVEWWCCLSEGMIPRSLYSQESVFRVCLRGPQPIAVTSEASVQSTTHFLAGSCDPSRFPTQQATFLNIGYKSSDVTSYILNHTIQFICYFVNGDKQEYYIQYDQKYQKNDYKVCILHLCLFISGIKFSKGENN